MEKEVEPHQEATLISPINNFLAMEHVWKKILGYHDNQQRNLAGSEAGKSWNLFPNIKIICFLLISQEIPPFILSGEGYYDGQVD